MGSPPRCPRRTAGETRGGQNPALESLSRFWITVVKSEINRNIITDKAGAGVPSPDALPKLWWGGGSLDGTEGYASQGESCGACRPRTLRRHGHSWGCSPGLPGEDQVKCAGEVSRQQRCAIIMQQERHAALVLGKPHGSGAAMQSGGTSLPYVRVEMTVCCGEDILGRGGGRGEGRDRQGGSREVGWL